MLNTPFTAWPSFSEEETQAVASVLRSGKVNYWTGDEARTFEREYANWTGCERAVALMNGTVALDAALQALGIGPGDEVVVTPRTFIASTSCVVNAGAVPVFADVDSNSGNLTADTIARVITAKTRAIIPVHLAGWPCEMDAIMELANENGVDVIEDCAQAHGANFRGRSVGSFGRAGVWSFCQDKIMTTGGEGGMLTTNDLALWSQAWSHKDHGKSYEAVYKRDHGPGFRWVHESFGTNWRLTEMQAAIGRVQLKRIPEWHRRRADNAARLAAAFVACSGLRVPVPAEHAEHAWYKFNAYVRPDALKTDWCRDRIIAEVNAAGVPCYMGSCPEVYLEKAFDSTGFRPTKRLPVARNLGETNLMFLVHPTLTDVEVSKTCQVVLDVMNRAMR